MKRVLILSLIFLLTISCFSIAQSSVEDAELQKMHDQARSYLSNGDYQGAKMLFHQAIRKAPGNVALRRDLAYTYYVSGNAKKAKEIIDPVLASDKSDEETFQIGSAIEATLGNKKRAKRILNQGIEKFPKSGPLYYRRGQMLDGEKPNGKDAIDSWKSGIQNEPGYPPNYYSLSKAMYQTKKPVWALIYGEIFVNLEPNTARTVEIKGLLIEAHKQLFLSEDINKLPDFNKKNDTKISGNSFEQMYKNVMNNGSGVLSKGIDTETLIMLRTRFILEWKRNYSFNYPFVLFDYHDQLIRSGHFDAYNQWLFGSSDNSEAFTLWVQSHTKEYSSFERWKEENKIPIY